MPPYPELVAVGDLRLERWDPARHTDGLHATCSDAAVMRFLGGRGLTREETEVASERFAAHWDTYGFGLWAAVDAAGETAGFVGACHPLWLEGYAHRVELGWRLRRDAWGRGYATRGGRAAAAAAFESLGEPDLVAFVNPENRTSLAVVERLGMNPVAEMVHPQLGEPLRVFELRAPG